MRTKIEWATRTWNIVEGCTKVSAGCKHCYAERLSKRMRRDFGKVELRPDRLDQPRHWRDSQVVFVCSRSDPFHPEVPSEFLWRAFEVMRETPQHRYLLLTKRPELAYTTWNWPDNVWFGVSAEDQPNADQRLTEAMQVAQSNGIKHLWLSAEPLLGPLDLGPWLPNAKTQSRKSGQNGMDVVVGNSGGNGISWVIVGGESGGPPERRLVERCACRIPGAAQPGVTLGIPPHCIDCHGTGWRPKEEAEAWVIDIRMQCHAAGAPFYFKQWGPRAGQGTELDGRKHKEMPEVRA